MNTLGADSAVHWSKQGPGHGQVSSNSLTISAGDSGLVLGASEVSCGATVNHHTLSDRS